MRELTPQEIQAAEEEEFQRLLTSGEIGSGGTNRSYDDYLKELPSLDGRTFEQYIDERLQEKAAQGDTTELAIVEVGYDTGQFLLACRKKWGNKVKLTGIGPSRFSKNTTNPDTGNSYYDDLVANGIIPLDEDATDIRHNIGDNTADVIIAEQLVQHVKYPTWELIKKFYRTLKQGGIAYINGGIQSMVQEGKPWHDKSEIVARFQNAHIPVYFGTDSMAVQKTSIDINALKIRSVPSQYGLQQNPRVWTVRLH